MESGIGAMRVASPGTTRALRGVAMKKSKTATKSKDQERWDALRADVGLREAIRAYLNRDEDWCTTIEIFDEIVARGVAGTLLAYSRGNDTRIASLCTILKEEASARRIESDSEGYVWRKVT